MVLAEVPWVPRWRLTTGSTPRGPPSPWGVWSLGVTGVRARVGGRGNEKVHY